MNWLKWLLGIVLLLLTLVGLTIYGYLHLSLPAYNGQQSTTIANTARLERDALGYLSVHAANRNDAAFALGFAHGQERFFQMDLLRRNAAGELAELFGERALDADKALRQHRFRARATAALSQLGPEQQQLLADYSRGVNNGLAALSVAPFEYALLRQTPREWQQADSFLVIYSMYLDLQGKLGRDDYAMTLLKQALPAQWYEFLQQGSAVWQAALDSSVQPPVELPATDYPALLSQYSLACNDCSVKDATDIGTRHLVQSTA